MILAPCHFLREPCQVRAGDVVVVPDFGAATVREIGSDEEMGLSHLDRHEQSVTARFLRPALPEGRMER